MISEKVEPLHSIRLECGHKVCKDRELHIPKQVISVEKLMIEVGLRQALFEPAWGPYRNAHFLVRKENGKYHFIFWAVSANRHTAEDPGIPPNSEECPEAFAGLPIASVIDFHSGYNQQLLHKDSQEYVTF
jgi:hypothetical protein